MKQIIINADDFGINQTVTKEIERVIDLGAISSTTIMANGQCLDEVKRYALYHPEISFGVHLCLSEFGCITKSSILKKYGLIDDNGDFIHKQIFNYNCFNEELISAIGQELEAQIEIIESLGIPISHADSHHHVHTIYPLKNVFMEVIKKHGIKRIRLGVDFDSWRSRRHLFLWNHRLKLNNSYKSTFVTTDKFSSYSHFDDKHFLSGNKNVIELMCHPGHPGLSYMNEMKQVEEMALIHSGQFELISYNDI